LPQFLFDYFELMIVTAGAALFNVFFARAFSLPTFFVFVIATSALTKMLGNSAGSLAARLLFRSLYYGLPNLRITA